MENLTAENGPKGPDSSISAREVYDQADEKARQALLSVLPEQMSSSLIERGVIQLVGKRAIYLISHRLQTEIRDVSTGKCIAHACLQLSILAPDYDRMLAEYLLLKNDEDSYWKIANIIGRTDAAVLLLGVFDLYLLLYLILMLVG